MSSLSKHTGNEKSGSAILPTAEWSDEAIGVEIHQFIEVLLDTEMTSLNKHVLRYNFAGVIEVTSADARCSILPAQAILLPANTFHSLQSKGLTSFLEIHFSDSLLTPKVQPLTWQSQIILADAHLKSLIDSVDHELSHTDLHSECALSNFSHLLAIHLIRKYSSIDLQLPHKRGRSATCEIMRAIEFIELNLTAPLHIVEICKLTNLSQKAFLQSFRQVTGDTPQQYLIKRRVELAKHLLGQQNLTVDEIAKRSGFVDQSHFTKAFRKVYSLTPSEYRKN